ncbi:MAG: extracellular solute-binding protein [Actinomycetia bacterium]|nr:extracellular solute-binding protein [Actinomycetes bacterium]MCH9703128.1 extracellular solute-binding protein [Actinomycetes bacterium]MCH9760775.1 extracellular solute-binding protein [Actinomycetes bacterium]
MNSSRSTAPFLPTVVRGVARAASALIVSALVACAAAEKDNSDAETPRGAGTPSGVEASAATSAEDFGGMAGLVAAAQAEGELNVIALPSDWANYGAIIEAFSEKYGIKVNSAQPNASSQDEIDAANEQRGRMTAPDVFDLGQSTALANTSMFAPYQVATFDDIPAAFKHPDGTWVNDYGGYVSIGFDSAKVPAVTDVNDLLKPDYQGMVALNGDPNESGAAFSGVLMVALSQGGSADNIAPGVEFFRKLKEAGNFLPVDPTPATIESGQTPVVIDWNYTNASATKTMPTWQVVVPLENAVAGYYYQAINKDAPHPAAARLWQEFLFSDAGQNLFARGGVRPVRTDSMVADGTLDRAVAASMPIVHGPVTVPTAEQTEAAQKYLSEHWAAAVG